MKKRSIAAVLIFILLSISLAACGGSSGTDSATPQSEQTLEAEASNEQSETEEEQNSGQQEETTADAEATVTAEKMPKLSVDTTIEETVLFEDDNVTIIAESLEFKYNAPVLNLKIENKGDKALSFVSGSIGYNVNSVNGYMVDGFYVNADVEPGKSALEEVQLSSDYLNILGIEKIREIGIGFDISDSDYNEYAKTGPLYLETSDAGEEDDSETFLKAIQSRQLTDLYGYKVDSLQENDFLAQDELKGISSGLITNKDGEQSLFLEVENTSDKVLNLYSEDILINGVKLVSGTWSGDTINPGKKRLMMIELDNISSRAGGTKEDLGMTEYASVKMNLHCFDENQNDIFEQEATFQLGGAQETFLSGQTEVYNNNDIVISYAKILQDKYGEANIIFLIENNSSKEIDMDVDYGTLSLNSVMTDFIAYSCRLEPETKGILNVEMSEYNLEDANITSIEEISDVAFNLKIQDSDYNEIDNPEIQVSVSK